MSILDINLDVLPFMQMTADDSFGNVARAQAMAEQFFKTYCGRNFEQTAMKEVIRYNSDLSLFLKEYPVISVQKLAAGRNVAVQVANSNGTTTAQVAVTATGVTLSYNYGAATTLAFAQYSTMTALAAAINSTGNGFSASVTPGYELTLSSELVPQMALECINNNTAGLAVPAQGLSGYQLNELTGEITTGGAYGTDTSGGFGSFPYTPIGYNALLTRPPIAVETVHSPPPVIYAWYTSGYAPGTVPADLKLGISVLIQALYMKVQENSFAVEEYSIERLRTKLLDLPAETKLALEFHKRRRI